MALGPVVTCTALAYIAGGKARSKKGGRVALTEDEIVWAEDLPEGSGADGVHGTGFQVDEDGAGHVFASGGLVVVDVDAF